MFTEYQMQTILIASLATFAGGTHDAIVTPKWK